MDVIQSRREELWNVVSHALGIILGVVGLILLLVNDNGRTAFSTLSIFLYALSIIILFSASTIYHAVTSIRHKRIWRKIDHISIYYLIAGTYTPVALITLESGPGWTIFWIVWIIAIVGTFLKIFFTGRFEKLSLFLYLAMGWLIIFYIRDVMEVLSSSGLRLMLLGGIFYTLGTIFYALKKMRFHHVIWHFFVLAGAVSHFCMVFYEVI
ncbi:hemolysin III family protein [Sungkyunkwania multivorans]|uniref:Hemolysin III family protein n=1 Tax=Sungkyunkwania multivorans TaxID=1173618 RepID=A0ABW3CT68_9FLAO